MIGRSTLNWSFGASSLPIGPQLLFVFEVVAGCSEAHTCYAVCSAFVTTWWAFLELIKFGLVCGLGQSHTGYAACFAFVPTWLTYCKWRWLSISEKFWVRWVIGLGWNHTGYAVCFAFVPSLLTCWGVWSLAGYDHFLKCLDPLNCGKTARKYPSLILSSGGSMAVGSGS